MSSLLEAAKELVRAQICCLPVVLFDKCIFPSRAGQGRSPGWVRNPCTRPRLSLEGILSLGAQPPLKNMCFLFSFSCWLRTE